jgi:hypothetical protein
MRTKPIAIAIIQVGCGYSATAFSSLHEWPSRLVPWDTWDSGSGRLQDRKVGGLARIVTASYDRTARIWDRRDKRDLMMGDRPGTGEPYQATQ